MKKCFIKAGFWTNPALAEKMPSSPSWILPLNKKQNQNKQKNPNLTQKNQPTKQQQKY